MNRRNITVVLERKNDGFVSLCPELDISERLLNGIYISSMEVMVG